MGLRIRGGRRGNLNEKSSLNHYISARGRQIATGNRAENTNESACASGNVSSSDIFPSSNTAERRKRNEALNQSILRTFDQIKSVTEEETFARNIHLELEKTVNDFNVDVPSSKSSSDDDDLCGSNVLSEMKGSGSEVSIHGVSRQMNGSLSKNMEETDNRSSSNVKSQVHHSNGILEISASEIETAHSNSGEDKGTNTCKNADSSGKDHPCSIEQEFFYSKNDQGNTVCKPPNGTLTHLRNKHYCKRKNHGLSQYRMAHIGKQMSHKFFNKLSKRNRLNFYKLAFDRRPSITRKSKSLEKDLKSTPKDVADDNYGRNRRQFQQKSPRKYLHSCNSIKFVKEVDLESSPGTSSGNQVITSGDVSTLPMILRNSVMAQNSDSEKDDDEDVIDSNIARNKNDVNEVVDVIDGIEFVTFENEHDMVQFTRLASDESGKGDLNDLGYSSEVLGAIIPKKTKDIKKIKGWQKKKFTVTQNPMLDPNSSEAELEMLTDLCPESIEYEHNYMMRRQLENKEEYKASEDKLPGLSPDNTDLSIIKNDMGELEECLVERDKGDMISVWKPSEKSAFVSFSASNSDPIDTSGNLDETASNTSNGDEFINQLAEPTKLGTCVHSEQQSVIDQTSMRSIDTLSPTSILMNKIKRRNAILKAKVIKENKSVQVDLPYEDATKPKRRHLAQAISEDELCKWSQSFEDVWHIDEKRALFAVSAVNPHGYLKQKHLTSCKKKVPGCSRKLLHLKRKNFARDAVHELPAQRRLLRSSTKKKTAPIRLTRSSINASRFEVIDIPSPSCVSKSSVHRKAMDTPASQNDSVNSLTTPSENLSSLASETSITKSSSSSLDQSTEETHQVFAPSVNSSQDPVSSFPKTLPSPSSFSEGLKKSVLKSKCKSIIQPNKSIPQELEETSRSEHGSAHRLHRRAKRKLIARKIWIIRRMRQLKALGLLANNAEEEFPRVSDLGNDELMKYSYLSNIKVKDGKIGNIEAECVGDESAEMNMTSSSISLEKKAKQQFQRKEYRPELENEELRVFLKPKPRLQAEALSPVKSSMESSVFFTGSNSKIEISHQLECSPPRKTEMEVIKSQSPNSPALSRKKLIRELQKLNANFVSVDPDQRDSVKNKCHKEFCRLGCVCDSIKTNKRLVDHCGKVDCMFSCICPSSESSSSVAKHLIIRSDTVSRLQEESSRHMAKVERYFHNTVVEAAGELVLPGRQQRERRLPKRFLDESDFPEVLLNSKKPKTSESCNKTAVDQSPIPVKLQPRKIPQYKKCSVSLGRFTTSEASVRCIYHARISCPCLKFMAPGRVPRNVAMKSTTQVRGKCTSSSIGPAFSETIKDSVIPAGIEQEGLATSTQSSFFESPDETLEFQMLSTPEIQSVRSENNVTAEELKGSTVIEENFVGEGELDSSVKKIIRQESHEEETSGAASEEEYNSEDISSGDLSINDEHLQCARTAGIGLWFSQLPFEKQRSKIISTAEEIPDAVPNLDKEEPEPAPHLAKEAPQSVPCLTKDAIKMDEDAEESAPSVKDAAPEAALRIDDVATEVGSRVENTVPEAAPKVEDETTEAAPKVEDETTEAAPKVEDETTEAASKVEDETTEAALQLDVEAVKVPQVPMENSCSGTDLRDLVRQDDSMPLFKIVEVKSLPPSSFESGMIAPTESEEEQKNIAGEMKASVTNKESVDMPQLDKKKPEESNKKKGDVKFRKFFLNFETFNLWLKSNQTVCEDLEKMCSKSLKSLPLNYVIVMKWSYLKQLLECHSAHLWLRQRFGSNTGSNSHIFVTQKDRPPDGACVNFLDLEKKEALSAKVTSLLRSAKQGNPKDMGCGILISKGFFWELSGHMTFDEKTKRNDFLDLALKKEPVVIASSSKPIHKLKTRQTDVSENIVNQMVGSKKVYQSAKKMHQHAEASLKNTTERSADSVFVSPDSSEAIIKVELDLETSMLSVVENTQSPSKSLKPKDNLDTESSNHDFGKHSTKDRNSNLTALGNENLSQRRGQHLPTKPRSGASERSNPTMLLDSNLNLERVPGTLNNAFIKNKHLNKAAPGMQSYLPLLPAPGPQKYLLGENSTSTSNLFKLGIFSQSLEPPPQILQFEDVEPSVVCQQELHQLHSLDLHRKREESNSKPSLPENKNDPLCNMNVNLNSEKANNHSLLALESANNIQEARNFNSPSNTELKGSPSLTTSSGNAFTGVKPPVLIIDLNKLRHGQIASNKNPVAIRVADFKSLTQGRDAKTRIDTLEKISPAVSIPQVKASLFPTVLQANQQIPVTQEKVIISKTLPMQYSICKDSVLVTCPPMNFPGGANMSSSKAIHVNIIKELNPTSQVWKKISSSDAGNSLKVTEGGERISSEQPETQKRFLVRKCGIPNVEQRMSLVAEEENCYANNLTFPPNGIPCALNTVNDNKRNSEASVEKLNIELNTVPSGHISTNNSWPKEATVNAERSKCSLVSYNMQGGLKVTPASTDQAIIPEDLPRSPSEKIEVTEIKDPLVPSDSYALSSPIHGVSLEETKQVSIKKEECLLEAQVSCIEGDNSSAKSPPQLQSENVVIRQICGAIAPPISAEVEEMAASSLDLSPQEEMSILTSDQVTRKSPLKIVPVLTNLMVGSLEKYTYKNKKLEMQPSFNGEVQNEPLKIPGKQPGCDDEAKGESITMPDAPTHDSKNGSECMVSKLEIPAWKGKILSSNSQAVFRALNKEVEAHNSLGDVKDKESVDQCFHHSLSSTFATSTSVTQSTKMTQSPKKTSSLCPKKTSTQSLKEASTLSPRKTSTQSPKKASTLSPKKTSIQPPEKASALSPKKSSTLSSEKASSQCLKKTSTLFPKVTKPPNGDSSDGAALLNLEVPEASNPPSPVEKVEGPNPSAAVEDKYSFVQNIHQSLLSSCGTSTTKIQSRKKASTASLNKASTQSLKKSLPELNLNLAIPAASETPSRKETKIPNPSGVIEGKLTVNQRVPHLPLSSFDTYSSEKQSPKEASSDCALLPTINQDEHMASKIPSPIKKAVVPYPAAAAEEKVLKVPFKHLSSCNTSMSDNLPLKKISPGCASPTNTPVLTPTSFSTIPHECESPDLTLPSSVLPSPCNIQEISTENDVIWYRLELNGEFDKLVAEETGFSTSSSRLISAVMIARTSNRTVRLAFDKKKNTAEKQQFKKGIYAVPTINGTYVRIGPYKFNEPTGVKTLKKVGDHHYKVIPNLLKVEVDTPEADGILNGVDALKPRGESNGLGDNSGEIKRQENKESNLISTDESIEGSQKISSEEAQIEHGSPTVEANDKPEIPIVVNKNAGPLSARTEIAEQKYCNMLLKIPKISLSRLSLGADEKHGNSLKQVLIDDIPQAKISDVVDPDLKIISSGTKCGEDNSEVGERLNVQNNQEGSPVVQTAECPSNSKEAINSLVINERTDSSNFCNDLDAKLECVSKENVICGIGKSQVSDPSLQRDDGLAVNVTVTGSKFKNNTEAIKNGVKNNKSVDFVEETAAETLNSHKFPNNWKRKMNVARKSTTINRAFMGKALVKKLVSDERMDMDEKTASEKLPGKQKVAIPQLITVKERDIQSEEKYECGYLIPDIPKLAPIPAKKSSEPSDSSVIIGDPTRPGVSVKFTKVEDASKYINCILHKHVRFFPSNLNIVWTYNKEKPLPSALGSVEIKHLSRDVFITCKGVFKYIKDLKLDSKQNECLMKDEDVQPVNDSVQEEIECAKVQLLSLIVPKAKINGVDCEKAIKKAIGEISFLQRHNELLSQNNVVEKRRKLQLDEKLRALLKAHGVETFSEFIKQQVGQMKNSPEKDLDQRNVPNKGPKGPKARSKCHTRSPGKGTEQLEKPGDNESTETVTDQICQTSEPKSTNSKNSQAKEDSTLKIISEAVPLPKGRVLRSSKNSNPLAVAPEISGKPASEENLPSSSSSSAVVKTSSIKEITPQSVNGASTDTVKNLISLVVSSNPDNKSVSGSSGTVNATTLNSSSERTNSQSSTSREKQAQHSSGEGKPVDAFLWKKSFSQVKINKVSLRSGTKEASASKRHFLRKKIDQKHRASVKCLDVSCSTSHPQTTNLHSKKRKS